MPSLRRQSGRFIVDPRTAASVLEKAYDSRTCLFSMVSTRVGYVQGDRNSPGLPRMVQQQHREIHKATPLGHAYVSSESVMRAAVVWKDVPCGRWFRTPSHFV